MNNTSVCKMEYVQEHADDWCLTWINGPNYLQSYIHWEVMNPAIFFCLSYEAELTRL